MSDTNDQTKTTEQQSLGAVGAEELSPAERVQQALTLVAEAEAATGVRHQQQLLSHAHSRLANLSTGDGLSDEDRTVIAEVVNSLRAATARKNVAAEVTHAAREAWQLLDDVAASEVID